MTLYEILMVIICSINVIVNSTNKLNRPWKFFSKLFENIMTRTRGYL